MSQGTIRELYLELRDKLRQSGIYTADVEAREFIKHAVEVADIDIIVRSDTPIGQAKRNEIDSWLARRLKGEPISRIFGEREFWGLPFKVTPDVLDPRPDTETIIEAALKRFLGDPPETILDMGTGTGCIIISLLTEWPKARGVAVDVCDKALAVANENAKRNGTDKRLKLGKSNWGESIKGKFDLIVSNPPYITNQEWENLDVSVKNFDPILALKGGEDGLDCYRTIVTETKKLLKPDGAAFFEVGFSQADDVVRLVEDSGLCCKGVHADIAGIPRVVEISFGEK
ncbi:MAG: peptide chain release factor N(5)-glutamine methyltransferase [Rhodospirillales bacterium]|nr:peptide chain release factor N(5)-glutamine methyltransferase [Rhodospirillales bacterium]MCB9991698.1 peptide chain release factor N(5)-glutamine methyltransferase [Rhodospirillales bacterium]MCB9995866.1 peptide chain release factor N(5)-glutamine methyltransferase [Rhodospirillales bacterium]